MIVLYVKQERPRDWSYERGFMKENSEEPDSEMGSVSSVQKYES